MPLFLRFNLNSINKKRRINILRFLLHSHSIEIVLNFFYINSDYKSGIIF